MAAKKAGTTKRRNTSTSRKKNTGETSGLRSEIILLVILAVSILLIIGNFGIGGKIGGFFSNILFGLFGFLAYIFPVLLFLGSAFYYANRNNPLVLRKMIGAVLFFSFFCAFMQLLMEGYTTGDKILSCYAISIEDKLGGGILGGFFAILLASAFGVIGAYVIIVIALIISAIIMTQKPLLKTLHNESTKVYHSVREDRIKRKNSRSANKAFEEEIEPVIEKEEKAAGTKRMKLQLPKLSKKGNAVSKQEKKKGNFDSLFTDTDLLNPNSDFSVTEVENSPLDEKKDSDSFDFNSLSPAFMSEAEEKQKKDSILPDMIELAPIDPVVAEVYEEEAHADIKKSSAKKNPKSEKQEIEDSVNDVKKEINNTQTKKKPVYKFPPISLLQKGAKADSDSSRHLKETALKLQQTLHNFGVDVTVTNASCGPTVTRYELQPEQGVKVSRITNLADDIKLNLAAEDIRIEAPIPGKAAVGIEVPNEHNSAVYLRDLISSEEFQNSKASLAFAAGKDIGGRPVITDIAKMPHLLIAGATGSGKSVCINTLIMSILYKANPEDVKLIMIDPKVVELSVYNGIPHLFIPVVTEPKKAAGALNWAVAEMMDRYNKFAQYAVRDIRSYNQKVESIKDIEDENKPVKMPQIVIIVDELADLMMVSPGEVEDAICRLAQLARAAGIHLIIATQRPSVNVITGLIKANMPSRIAFSVSSGVDSRTILDMNGAEKLLGKGDMLFYPQGYAKPARVQGAFVSDKEVSDVVDFLTKDNPSISYDEDLVNKINTASVDNAAASASSTDVDAYFVDAGKFIIEKDKASIGMLQRVFKIGFNRAARIMDQLCDAGVVGEEEGTKPRKVLMSVEQFENYIEESM